MHRPAHDDRDWTHWPGRGQGSERPRGRLRSLFSPSDSETEALEAVIEERGRELEQRAAALAAVVADLEAREASVQAQRASAEALLRDGSAELDERHAELSGLAQELAEREQALAAREAALDERRRELGAVELLRASVERREAALARRETELERQAADLAAALAASTAAHEEEPVVVRTDAHLLVVPGDGYRLVERRGLPPAAGEPVTLDGKAFRVTRLGPSPLPDDDRRCAYLESAP